MNVRSVIWEDPGLSMTLPHDEIHIWRACLEQPEEVVSALSKGLTEDERENANKYYYNVDRARFIIGRSLLKKILSTYLSCNPEDISVIKNAYGKPYLPTDRSNIDFSVAHSRDLALYSLVKGTRMGIDVEYKNPYLSFDNMGFNCLSTREKGRYRNTPEKLQTEFFLKNWTLKEAYVKALGVGHYFPFDRLDVSFLAFDASTDNGEIHMKSTWYAYHFTPAFDYLAALVVEEKDNRLPFTRSVYFHLNPTAS